MIFSDKERFLPSTAAPALRWGAAILLTAAVLCLPGCRRHSRDESAPAERPSAGALPTGQSSEAAPEAEKRDSTRVRPEPVPGLTADSLLRDMLAVYQKAKLYSDHGYIETVYENQAKERVAERAACSIIFKKPNYLRMEIVGGLLACDGEKIRAKLLDPFYDAQLLELPAPLLFSSIRELYPDIKLADAMDMGIPSNIFWTPPQLILLLAKEPLKTFIPQDARVELLSPEWFQADETADPIPCDRVEIASDDGSRILWIDRSTRGLVRLELPLEQIALPEGMERVLSQSIQFANLLISEDPTAIALEPGLFEVEKGERQELVKRFLPPELFIFGKPAPPIRLRPLASGWPEIRLDETHDKNRVITLWGGQNDGDLPVWQRSQIELREMQRSVKSYGEDDQIEFIAVNIDPSARSDSLVRSDYGNLNLSPPLYRMNPSEMRKTLFSQIAVPSLVLVDKNGVVQKYYSSPLSSIKLDYQIQQLLDGVDIYQEDFKAFEVLSDNFRQAVEAAESNDLYRTKPDTGAAGPTIAPKENPKTFSLSKAWWNPDLLDPGNPLAISGLPEEKPGGAALMIPCEGNIIALLDKSGKVLTKKIPETGAGEPISFLRTLRTRDGNRFFAASSFLDSRKVHLFDAQFELLGSLDVGRPRQQWVGDVLLTDAENDGKPEVIMALVGDAASNLIPTHGIYAVPLTTEKNAALLWKDEKVISPFRLGLLPPPSGAENDGGSTLLAMNFPVDEMGKLVADRFSDGSRVGQIDPPEGMSILWFASDRSAKTGRIAAITARAGSSTPSLCALDGDGKILREEPLAGSTWSAQMERITFADMNGDGQNEWLVPTGEGIVWIFSPEGEPLDRFAVGEELSGLCAAAWNGSRYLILTGPGGVTAWMIGEAKPDGSGGLFE